MLRQFVMIFYDNFLSIIFQHCQMPKKVYANPKVREVQRNQISNASTVAINSSYLHEGYYSRNVTLSLPSSCDYCKKLGSSPLLSVCECEDKLFHQGCFRHWVSEMVSSKRMSVTEEDGYKIAECGFCHSKIKFKAQVTSRCSSCSQMSSYCSEHMGFTVGIIFNLIIIIASLICVILILLGILKFDDSVIERSAVLIAFGIIAILMLIVCLCCSIDCLKSQKIDVGALYDRNGRVHKSRNHSRRSSRTGTHTNINIENIE